MAELSNFQENKISKLFTMLYDSNNDGVIEKRDFDIYLQKVSQVLGWKSDSEKYLKAQETLNTVWDGLKEYADTDKDAKITLEEWLRMWRDCLKDIEAGEFPAWQKKYMDLMFDVNDMSGDELIDMEEYKTFLTQFGVSQDECSVAFSKISGGSDITREQFASLWRGYLTSNDKEAAANFLFGTNQ
ncbi:calexcitin-2-like [Mya arenaria]|uniref:calexcitin-2-like n=1 Tax=Mya arenaria TaxID=6604 RepID=UPI0022E97F6A|nr:calexcitin-2-like [Mya arenaria]